MALDFKRRLSQGKLQEEGYWECIEQIYNKLVEIEKGRCCSKDVDDLKEIAADAQDGRVKKATAAKAKKIINK